jgi:hypothetical protein
VTRQRHSDPHLSKIRFRREPEELDQCAVLHAQLTGVDPTASVAAARRMGTAYT